VNKKNKGFTLQELLVVVVIIAIFAALGLPQLVKTKEHALSKEATANLKLIAAAEKIYRMEAEDGNYYPSPSGTSSTISDINSYLRLFIPSSSSRNWDYSVTAASGAFTTTATRTTQASGSYSGCTWTITNNDDVPTTSSCP